MKIINASGASGVTCCKATVKRIAQEMRNQEHLNDLVFQKTGRVSGVSFSPNKKGKVGRITKLTAEVKEAYRTVVTRYAYSWTTLSEGKLKKELEKVGHKLSSWTIHEHLRVLKKRTKIVKLKTLLREEQKENTEPPFGNYKILIGQY